MAGPYRKNAAELVASRGPASVTDTEDAMSTGTGASETGYARFGRIRVLAAVAVVVTGTLLPTTRPAWAAAIVVSPGQSIQAAVDAAPVGSRIEVRPGTYAESVVIAKDHVTLVGAGPATVIVPPATPNPACFPGRPSGICVLGNVDPSTSEVIDPVEAVEVRGFAVRAFSGGFGIRVRGAKAAFVTDNVVENSLIGIFDSLSVGSRYVSNMIAAATEEGVLVRGSTHVTLTQNSSFDNSGQGIIIVDSSTGRIEGNEIHGNCEGISLVDFGEGVRHWVISGNTVHDNSRACPAVPGVQPPLSGIGIDIVGATDTMVQNNSVRRNRPSGPTIHSGGIVVTTSPFSGGIEPMRNRVVSNTAHENQSADIVWNGRGAGNVFAGNVCDVSLPSGFCH